MYIYVFKNNNNKFLHMYWFKARMNFGDVINIYLVKQLSTKTPIWVNIKYWPKTHFLVIGSVLESMNSNSIIWGSGFISSNTEIKAKPKRIFAVRGPKTRRRFLENGIDCPEVYGDPALLLPIFYFPKIQKKYKIGLIPHYVDKNHKFLNTISHDPNIKIIDIEQENPLDFINDILECETIVSSSLHGLIVSDAYSIPSIWVKFSEGVKGDNFKFFDYFESVGRINEKVISISLKTNLHEVAKGRKAYNINLDLDKLLDACPFSEFKGGKQKCLI